MTESAKDILRLIRTINVAENLGVDSDTLEEVEYRPGRFLVAHKVEHCEGPCPIHNPSDHHMVDWPLHWRDDRGIFERFCPCGTGHPDPDTIAYIEKMHGKKVAGTESVHGCCGCCVESFAKAKETK